MHLLEYLPLSYDLATLLKVIVVAATVQTKVMLLWSPQLCVFQINSLFDLKLVSRRRGLDYLYIAANDFSNFSILLSSSRIFIPDSIRECSAVNLAASSIILSC